MQGFMTIYSGLSQDESQLRPSGGNIQRAMTKSIMHISLLALATVGFFHTCRSRAHKFFRTSPCTLLGRNSHSHILCRLGVVHAGAKLDTRGHRSATDFALGPFHMYNFQQQQRPGSPGPPGTEHLLPKKLADTHHHGAMARIEKPHPQLVFTSASITVPLSQYSTMGAEAP